MEKKYYVYTHSINGKVFYVGSNYRAGNPYIAYEKSGRSKKWYEIVNENNENYDIEIIQYFDTSTEAINYERQLIRYYHDIGLAQASGEDYRGERNGMYGKENKWGKHTEDSKKKISKANSGEKNGMYNVTGKNHPMFDKGYLLSGENHWLYGKGELISGKNNPMYGRTHSEEAKKKIGQSSSKEIIVFKDGKFYGKYSSSFEFAKEMGSQFTDDSVGKAVHSLSNGWVPTKRSKWHGWKVIRDITTRANSQQVSL